MRREERRVIVGKRGVTDKKDNNTRLFFRVYSSRFYTKRTLHPLIYSVEEPYMICIYT